MYVGENGSDNTFIFRNNTQNSGTYGIYFNGSSRNIIISDNTFSNLSRHGVYHKFLINGVNLNINKNIFANIGLEGIYIDGNSMKNGAVKIQNNILINVNTTNSSSGITVKNVQNATISGNQIFKGTVAAFSASPASGYAPLTVRFADRSIGSPTSWKWNFGDGTYSTQKNPSHTYSKAGKYTVSLTVKSAAGRNTITKSSFVAVNAPRSPVAAFSASPLTGKALLTVKFTDKSAYNPTYWSWDFGDKSTSTVKNPTHKYTKAGKYTVKLTVKNSKGINSVTKPGYVIVK
jgi:PKD repeat protein